MSEKYEFIETMLTALHKYVYPVRLMCEWLSVSRSGFYDWRSRPTSAAASRHAELSLLVRHVFEDSDQTYGYRRVHAHLARLGHPTHPETIRVLMRELGLVACQPRPWRPTTTIAGDTPDHTALVNQDCTRDPRATQLVGRHP
mgnify:CR=1 FL=1